MGEKEFITENLQVRISFIIVMIRWTGLAPWDFNSLFQVALYLPAGCRLKAIRPPRARPWRAAPLQRGDVAVSPSSPRRAASPPVPVSP